MKDVKSKKAQTGGFFTLKEFLYYGGIGLAIALILEYFH